eukprot:gene7495-13272_t
MTSSFKPWEAGSNERQNPHSYSSRPSVRIRPGVARSNEKMNRTDSPPPIPSRQRNDENRFSNQMYGSYYGNSSYGMYGGVGGYGYGNQPYMYNRPLGYGQSSIAPSTFARRAEDSCRPAFDSVQSIVQAFASIATMLDSTFFAVHSSFRAVLGVADQLSGLRAHIANTLGALTIFRVIQNIFKKLMRWLRLRNGDIEAVEMDVWAEATKEIADKQRKSKSWPVVLFFAVVLGTPWLIWKLLQTISNDENIEEWITGDGEHFEAEAEYDFDAENEDEISFQAGDSLRVAPKQKQPHVRGWLLASVDGKVAGLVPANHVKILGRRRGCSKRKRGRTTKEMQGTKIEELDEIRSDELGNESMTTQNEQFNDLYEETIS